MTMKQVSTEVKKPGKHTVWSVLLIVFFLLPSVLLLLIPLRGQKTKSTAETRPLTTFPPLSFSAFVKGEFQQGFEDATADQYLWAEEIKGAVGATEQFIFGAEQGILAGLLPDDLLLYSQVADGYYHYGNDEHRIVERPAENAAETYDFSENAQWFNELSGVKKYVYLIRNSRVQDFSRDEKENSRVYENLCAAYGADGYGCFTARDYEDYCALFYQTDHHWNHIGADRGYREIMGLMGVDEANLFMPVNEVTYEDTVFNGSYAKQAQLTCADEPFSVYQYDLPKLKITLDGKKSTAYGNRKQYDAGKYNRDPNANHYALYYGGDYGEIVIDSGNSDRPNLLVVADSYSNPVNLLLASHFGKTYIIDLRYYEDYAGHPFCATEYVAEYGIDTVLMMGDAGLFGALGKEGSN